MLWGNGTGCDYPLKEYLGIQWRQMYLKWEGNVDHYDSGCAAGSLQRPRRAMVQAICRLRGSECPEASHALRHNTADKVCLPEVLPDELAGAWGALHLPCTLVVVLHTVAGHHLRPACPGTPQHTPQSPCANPQAQLLAGSARSCNHAPATALESSLKQVIPDSTTLNSRPRRT